MSASSRSSRRDMIFRATLLDAVVIGFVLLTTYFWITAPSTLQLNNPDIRDAWDAKLLDLRLNSTLAALSLGIGATLSFILHRMRIRSLGVTVFDPHPPRSNQNPWYRTFWFFECALAVAYATIVSAHLTKFSFMGILDADGFAGAKRIFGAMFHPNLAILPQGILKAIETIFIAFLATAISVPLAFVLGFLASKNIMSGNKVAMTVYGLLRTILNGVRSVEPLLWAIVFSVWVGVGPFAGMLALMIHSVASLAKQYSEQIECVSEGPIEGIQSTGANTLQTVWFAIVPQVVLPFVAFTIYRWDINVRMATIIGLVGGGGIGSLLMQYQGQAMWNEVGALILLIAAVVWLMDAASAYIREAIK